MITSGGRGRVSPARARRPARIVEGRRTADASCHIRRSGGWADQMTRPGSRRPGGLRDGPAGTRPRPATGADLDKELVGAPVDIAPTSRVSRPSGPLPSPTTTMLKHQPVERVSESQRHLWNRSCPESRLGALLGAPGPRQRKDGVVRREASVLHLDLDAFYASVEQR